MLSAGENHETANSDVDVFHIRSPGTGWWPIVYLSQLLADCFGANLHDVDCPKRSRGRTLEWALLGKSGKSQKCAILIARRPADLRHIVEHPGFRKTYGFVAAWIVDSFFVEELPSRRSVSHFDILAQMSPVDHDFYNRLAGSRSRLLPFGSDVLGLGGAGDERDVDVLRVGRQPLSWDDDERSAEACRRAGLVFHGRPQSYDSPAEQQRGLASHYQRSKYTIAHSNLVASHSGTHPRKEYITARWTDAASSGAVIAGVHPRTDPSMQDLLWPEATIELDGTDLNENISALASIVEHWSKDTARINYRMSLERLDWRWRFKDLANQIGLSVPGVDADLEKIRTRIAELDREISGQT